jgi:hypothetical protein
MTPVELSAAAEVEEPSVHVSMRAMRSRRTGTRDHFGILVGEPRVGRVLVLIKNDGRELLETTPVVRILRCDQTLVVQTRNTVYRIDILSATP